MTIRRVSPRALKILREKNILPLPALSTLQSKFSFIHICPGIIKPVIGELYDSFDCKSGLVKYHSQSEVIKVMLMLMLYCRFHYKSHQICLDYLDFL